MIEYLRGILLERGEEHLLLEVQGVGYGLTVPSGTAAAAGEPGAEVALWVRTYVREDTLRLYGFATRHEREVFDVMIGISGIGPSLALVLLSNLSIAQIVQAAATGDVSSLKKVKGIGLKTAEKLILELKGRVDRLAAGLPADARAGAEAGRTGPSLASLPSEAARDAVAALEALGVRPDRARLGVEQALAALGMDASVEALVREGLKYRR